MSEHDPTDPAERAVTPEWLKLVVVAACLVQLGLGLVWSTMQPPLKGLDETQHTAAVLHVAYHDTWPAPKHLHVPDGLQHIALYVAKVNDPRKATIPVPRGQRPSFSDFGGESPSEGISQMTQHPPLYYALVAAVVRAVPGGGNRAYDQEVLIMRWVSAVILLPLPALAFAAMRRFTRDRFLLAGATLAALLVPGIARAGGSVSNDALEITLTAALTVVVARILTGDRSVRTGVLAGLFALLDLLTKGTALIAVPWLLLAYTWAWWQARSRPTGRAPLGRAAAWCGMLTAIGLAWWVRNVVAFGAIQPSGESGPVLLDTPSRHYHEFITKYFSALSFRFWASLGSPEPPQLDRGLAQAATFTVLALLLVGLVVALRRRQLVAQLILLVSTVGMLGIITLGSFGVFLAHHVFTGVQGRYLYPALVAIIIPALFAVGAVLRGLLRPLLPVVVLVFVVLLQLAGLRDALRYNWQPVGGGLPRAAHLLLDWAPFPVGVTYAVDIAALLFVVVLVMSVLTLSVAGLVRGSRSPDAV